MGKNHSVLTLLFLCFAKPPKNNFLPNNPKTKFLDFLAKFSISAVLKVLAKGHFHKKIDLIMVLLMWLKRKKDQQTESKKKIFAIFIK